MTSGRKQVKQGGEDELMGWEVGPDRPFMPPRCFISERWCMSEKDICDYWDKRKSTDMPRARPRAFVIMPYNRRSDLIYEAQIKPMLANLDQPVIPFRADTLMRTGYIVCQKICQPILMSDLVVVEMTHLNKNVLYELGLSLGLDRKILLMAQEDEKKKGACPDDLDKLFRLWGLGASHNSYFLYRPFECILASAELLQEFLWKTPAPKRHRAELNSKVGILGGDHWVPRHYGASDGTSDSNGNTSKEGNGTREESVTKEVCNASERFQLTDALRSQMGNSLRDAICRLKHFDDEKSHEEFLRDWPHNHDHEKKKPLATKRKEFLNNFVTYLKRDFKEIEEKDRSNKPYYSWMFLRSKRTDQSSFDEIMEFINSCEYLMVDVSPSHDPFNDAINLFWIGYCHGKGKRVIPVEVFEPESGSGEDGRTTFDIQGLYYFGYDTTQPQKVCNEFYDLFYNEVVKKDLLEEKEQARSRFWKPFFHEQGLKIFVGAAAGRQKYALNEWDYLALAELDRYFTIAKPILQNKIIAPIYQQESDAVEKLREDRVQLNNFLEKHLKGHNCIVIGSPDSNIMTELVLAKALNLAPFRPDIREKDDSFRGCVTLKESGKHIALQLFKDAGLNYGFKSSFKTSQKPLPKKTNKNLTFCKLAVPEGKDAEGCDKDSTEVTSFHHSYGYFYYFDNPYSPKFKVIVIAGVVGPATLALAQMLTGNRNNPNPSDAEKSKVFRHGTWNLPKPESTRTRLTLNFKKGYIIQPSETPAGPEGKESKASEKTPGQKQSKDPHQIVGFKKDLKNLFSSYGNKVAVKSPPVGKEIGLTFSDSSIPERNASGEFEPYPDYLQMSADILARINEKISALENETDARRPRAIVGAIVRILVEDTTERGDELQWRDPRRVVGWRLAEDSDAVPEEGRVKPGEERALLENPFLIEYLARENNPFPRIKPEL